MSSQVRALLSSDLAHRYTARDHFYMGTQYTDKIEQYGEKLAKQLFNAETADLRPLSGHIADLITIANLTKPNDTLLCTSPENGGYPGMWKNGLATLFKLKAVSFPFNKSQWSINIQKAQKTIQKHKPKIIIFGASLILFPQPVKQLTKTAHDNNAFIGYDGSHVLGLIAGQQFQNPLKEGAQALFGSTHKSFFGPQGGIILADKETGQHLKNKIYPAFVDNAHWNRIAALTLALAEMKHYGKAYAIQIIRNAQTLAKALSDYGFPVRCPQQGFTQSHQLILDFGNYDKGRTIAKKLEKANIIADCAVRLGTCEITRKGMKKQEMHKIAELIHRVINKNEHPDRIKKETARIAREFHKIEYCFE